MGHAGSTDAAASGDDGDLPAAEKYGTISKQPVGNIRNMWKTKVRRRLPLMMLLWVAVGCCGLLWVLFLLLLLLLLPVAGWLSAAVSRCGEWSPSCSVSLSPSSSPVVLSRWVSQLLSLFSFFFESCLCSCTGPN